MDVDLAALTGTVVESLAAPPLDANTLDSMPSCSSGFWVNAG